MHLILHEDPDRFPTAQRRQGRAGKDFSRQMFPPFTQLSGRGNKISGAEEVLKPLCCLVNVQVQPLSAALLVLPGYTLMGPVPRKDEEEEIFYVVAAFDSLMQSGDISSPPKVHPH